MTLVWTMREEPSAPPRLGGWLLLLSRILLIYQPINLAVSASAALASLPTRGPKVLVAIAVRVLAAGVAVAAGLALTNRQPNAVGVTRAALLISAACDVFVYTTPFAPNNRPPGDTPYYVAASILFHAAWLLYLSRSTRVRTTFG
jgi:hypothetical protein